MSLKHVHLAFVVAAMLLTTFCAVRAMAALLSGGSWMLAVATVGAVVIVALLVQYQHRFLRACREAGIQ
jgi:hypothetical protein